MGRPSNVPFFITAADFIRAIPIFRLGVGRSDAYFYSAAALEKLYGAFVFLRGRSAFEGSEIFPFAGFLIFFTRVKPIFSGGELANHCYNPVGSNSQPARRTFK